MHEVLRHTGLSFIFLLYGSFACADLKDSLLAEGNALYDQKDYAPAGAVFAKLIEADPTSADGYYGQAMVNAAQGDYDAAIRDFSEAIRRNPQKGGAYRNRGAAYLRTNWQKRCQILPRQCVLTKKMRPDTSTEVVCIRQKAIMMPPFRMLTKLSA